MTECRYVCRRELFNAVTDEESCREAVKDFAGLFAENGDSIENFEGMLVIARQDTSYSGLFKHEDLINLEKSQIGCGGFREKYFPESKVCMTCGLCPDYANKNNDTEKAALIYLSTLTAKERNAFFPSDRQALNRFADKFKAYDDVYHIKRTNGIRHFIPLNRQIYEVFASIHHKGMLADGKLAAVKAGDFYREWDSINPDAPSSAPPNATDEEKETAASVRSYLATRLKYIVAESRKPMSAESIKKVRELMNTRAEEPKPQANLTSLVSYIASPQAEPKEENETEKEAVPLKEEPVKEVQNKTLTAQPKEGKRESAVKTATQNINMAQKPSSDIQTKVETKAAENGETKNPAEPVQDIADKTEEQPHSEVKTEQKAEAKEEPKSEPKTVTQKSEVKATPADKPAVIDYSLFAVPVVSRQEYEQYALKGRKERTEQFISMISEKTLQGIAVLIEPVKVEESEIYGFIIRFADAEDYFIAEKDDEDVMYAVKKLLQSRTDVKITDKAIPLYYMAYLCNILCPECIVPRMTAEESVKSERNAIARMKDYAEESEVIRTRSYIRGMQNIEKGMAHSLYGSKPGETCMFTYMPEYRFVFKKNDIKPTEETEIINVIVGQKALSTAQFSESIVKLIGQFEANNVFRKKTVRLVQIAFSAGSFALEVKKEEYRGVCSLISRHYMKVLHQLTKQPVFKLVRG